MKFTHAQEEALHPDMSIFVEAGAGSGKTAVLVERFIRTLQKNPTLHPSHIIAITFTQKAAQEMAERIAKRIPHLDSDTAQRLSLGIDQAQISTIHGLCCRILKKAAPLLGISAQFTVLQTEPTLYLWQLACDLTLAELKQQHHAGLSHYLIRQKEPALRADLNQLFPYRDRIENLLKSTLSAHQQAQSDHDLGTVEALQLTMELLSLFQKCLTLFQLLKNQQDALDYTDLLTFTHQALQHPPFLNQMRARIHTVMVDEFQDTDPLQWAIIQLLTGYLPQRLSTPKPLFLVGDIRQSIYGFRGADPGLFSHIKSIYLQHIYNSTLVQLKENFRTQKPILDWVNTTFLPLFKDANTFSLLPMRSEETGKVDIQILEKETHSLADEAKIAADWIIQQLKTTPDLHFQDIGILLRRKKGMLTVQKHLQEAGIPSVVEGDQPHLSEEKITLFCLLKALLTQDTIARIRMFTHLFELETSDLLALYNTSSHPTLITIAQWTQLASVLPLSELLSHIANTFPLPISPKELSAMITLLQNYEQEAFITPKTVLKKLALGLHLPQKITQIEKNAVRIMTIHSAKGLEFPTVILPDCGKTFNFSASDRLVITPKGVGLSYKPKKEQANAWRQTLLDHLKTDTLEEEKRLFYVACTRAKDHLLLLGRAATKTASLEEASSFLGFLTI